MPTRSGIFQTITDNPKFGVGMRAISIFLGILIVCSFTQAAAQMTLQEGREGEVLSAPICGKLINRSDQTIMGTLMTAAQEAPSGDMVKHRDNFTLESGKEREFCAAGPFYEGRRVELTLRTVIPLFSCKTKLDAPIYLDAKEDENGIKKLSATCS